MHTSLLLTWIGVGQPVHAADWIVDPSPAGLSIQETIAAADDGDMIQVQAGTYTESIDFLGKSLEIMALGDVEETIITGDSATTDGAFIRFGLDESPAATLRGFTISGDGQPCIFIDNASPSLISLTLTGCGDHSSVGSETTEAGGVLIDAGSPSFEDVHFVSNRADVGAGIRIEGESDVTLIDCSFTGGVSTSGSAIYIADGALSMTGTSFSENTAMFGSGGAMFASDANLSVVSSTFSNNTATYDGGAISQTLGSLHIEYLEATDNAAEFGHGGALFLSDVDITGMTVLSAVSNSAGQSGGALHIDGIDDTV